MNYKRKIQFRDENKNLIKIEIEIKEGKLSMIGDYGKGSGQIQDEIKPASTEQEQLKAIWKEFHLNDLQPGTPAQMEALKEFKGDYTEQCKYLESIDLLIDNGYKYGTGWKTKPLPEDITDQLDELLDSIEQQEEEKEDNISELEDTEILKILEDEYNFSEPEKIVAIIKHLELSKCDLDGIEEDETSFTVQGTDYIIATDEEADELTKENIKESVWAFNPSFLSSHSNVPQEMFEAVQDKCESSNEMILDCIDDLEEFVQDAISSDGRGHFLNHYDGSEEEEEVNGETYYIYRQ